MSEEKPETIKAGARRAVRGSVISSRMDKSITVLVVRQFMHPLLKKWYVLAAIMYSNGQADKFRHDD